MSRILLTWELGLNHGHLARLLPVAQRLKSDGHVVLVAARDIRAAATVLGPAGIAFVPAPFALNGIPLAHRPAGYADILLSQGWSDLNLLRGLTHAWLNLFRLFQPDRLLLDYSPTVSLAARIAGVPAVLIGNGFEMPPLEDPLPCFPGFSWATAAKAAESEARAVVNANTVLRGFGGSAITALRDLVLGQTRLLATLPELDHYGPRTDTLYIGPLLPRLPAPAVAWPPGEGPKLFACLRPDTSQVQTVLTALGAVPARVICVAAGFSGAQLEPFRKDHVRYTLGPVDLDCLGEADLCITYGAEGVMWKFLLAGVPQVISPWHVETYMAARRVESAGLGATLPAMSTQVSAESFISKMLAAPELLATARGFARRSASFLAASDGLSVVAQAVR